MSTKGNWLLLDVFSSTQQQSSFFVEAVWVTRMPMIMTNARLLDPTLRLHW